MTISLRAYAGAADQQRMAELARTFPDGNLHVVDLPYRLSSWAFDYPEAIGLWEDDDQQLVAWAVFQTPFWAIDYVVHPASDQQQMMSELLAWASMRIQQFRDQPNGRPMWFAHVRADQSAQMHALEQGGFYSVEHHPESPWYGLYLERGSQAPVPEYTLPAGYIVRPLAGESEVAAYVDLHRIVFGSPSMTVAWRTRTLHHPDYLPELDLVVEAPDGQIVAFCICWFTLRGPGHAPTGQVEPLGVHPDYRKQGLGNAVLREGLRRLQSRGVASMIVETDDGREAAIAVYTSAGFEITHKIIIYRKDVAGTQ
jgi:ribosomal protein S18 acetylase RimI-like enzyme